MNNTDHGIIVAFRCWCGAEQTMITGRKVAQSPKVAVAA